MDKDKKLEFLNQKELAKKWSISTKTLESWRSKGSGPKYYKLGNNIRYKVEDIVSFEEEKSYADSPSS